MGFKTGIAELAQGRILAPILRAELTSPSFRGFTIQVDQYTEREPDGWFHPSEHSHWPTRKLALYLTQPALMDREPPTLEKTLAVTQGHFMHGFVGQILQRNGIVEELEIYKEDPEHNRRGHMDGRRAGGGEGIEFKSVNQKYLLDKIGHAESLEKHKPGYYGQCQDYMDMHELPAMRFLLIGVFYPYPMSEFVVLRDEMFIREQRAKYKEALEMVAEGVLPYPCCRVGSDQAKVCEMRRACPVGTATARAA